MSGVGRYEDKAENTATCYKYELYGKECPSPRGSAKPLRAAAYEGKYEYLARAEYANQLSYQYKRAARAASQGQDAGAIGIIAAAGTAAGGLLFGSSLNLVKGAGLFAGVTTANLGYFRPEQAQLSLLTAAQQARCIADVARPPPSDLLAGRQVLNRAIDRVQMSLAVSYARAVPDFAVLVAGLQLTALQQKGPKTAALAGERSVEQLQRDVNACLPALPDPASAPPAPSESG